MVYISNGVKAVCRFLLMAAKSALSIADEFAIRGQVLDSRSRAPWSLSFITDLFWGIADFVALFFQSIIQPDLRRRGYASSSSSRYDDGRGPPGFPRRRMGRINHFGGPSPPPMAGGG